MDLKRMKKRNRMFLLLLLLGFAAFIAVEWIISVLEDDSIGNWTPVDAEVEWMIELPATETERPQIIDLNTATSTQLQQLSGVGPVKAEAIIEYRTQHGPFTSVEQIMEVKGIGEATFQQLQGQITVGAVEVDPHPDEERAEDSQAGKTDNGDPNADDANGAHTTDPALGESES